ncbi:MAG: outer membrane beta-barrel protein [Burkholderiales bacterium]|nr:outer membrane beta-barrel protein [Burkholderiales bacterium]
MAFHKSLAIAALGSIAFGALAEDYVGVLKPPKSDLQTPPGFFSLASEPVASFAPARNNGASDSGYRLKLGYQYSRFFAVEGQFVDFGRTSAEMFASPANLASAFRSSGFGVDTVAMLPWRSFSFYGRLGAYRGESRNAFAQYSTSLLGDASSRGTRWHYGMGVRYDFTKSLGVRAEVERYSPLGTPLDAQVETDLISVGVSWRF